MTNSPDDATLPTPNNPNDATPERTTPEAAAPEDGTPEAAVSSRTLQRFRSTLNRFVVAVMVGIISFSIVIFTRQQAPGEGTVLGLGEIAASLVLARALIYLLQWFRPAKEEDLAWPERLSNLGLLMEAFLAGVAILLIVVLRGSPESLFLGLQWTIALWVVLRILRIYWNCFEMYWHLLFNCPILSLEIFILVGLAFGGVLAGYGLIPVFWGDGTGSAIWIVPLLSSFMMVMTVGVLLLCAYFAKIHQFDESFAGPDGLARDVQLDRRARAIWTLLLPQRSHISSENDPYRNAGNFVWICLRPIIFGLALPAVLPIMTVEPRPTGDSRLGWIVGLAVAAYLFRKPFVRIISWVAVRALRRGDLNAELVTYTTRLNCTGLMLLVVPVLSIMVTAHLFNQVLHASTFWPSLCIALATTALWLGLLLRNRWQKTDRRTYILVYLLLLTISCLLSLIAQVFNLYIAAPFGLCWLLMGFGLFITCMTALFNGHILHDIAALGQKPFRKGIQFALVGIASILLFANGCPRNNGRKALLERYEVWAENDLVMRSLPESARVTTPVSDEQVKPEFGSAALKRNVDDDVLTRWHQGAVRSDSDAAVKTGRWTTDGSNPPRSAAWTTDDRVKPKLVVVAVSGGGLRAAVWAEKVLYELANEIPEFADRTRLITGSSGGMLGAAYLVTGLKKEIRTESSKLPDGKPIEKEIHTLDLSKDLSKDKERKGPRTVNKQIHEDLHHDFLTPVLQRMIFGDLFSTVSRYLGDSGGETEQFDLSVDRGQVLEETLRARTRGINESVKDDKGHTLNAGLKLKFKELAELGESRGRIPSLVFTPTIVEDSRRLVISNLDLGPLLLNHGSFDPLTGKEVYEASADLPTYSTTGIQFFHLFPEAYGKIDLATAVRLNATFPYVTPARTLLTGALRRAVDAGYYDNYGIDFATSWIEQHRRWLEVNTSGVVLIQVRAFSNERQLKKLLADNEREAPTDAVKSSVTNSSVNQKNRLSSYLYGAIDNVARGAEFFTTPLTTVGAARSNVNYYRNDGSIENLKRSFTFDMIERMTGISTGHPSIPANSSPANGQTAASDAPLSEAEIKLIKESYSAANGFFRVFTFTCSNPQVDNGDAAFTETLSWYLSDSEFNLILANWNTIDNYRRFQYLRSVFRRYFSQDDEADIEESNPATNPPGFVDLTAQKKDAPTAAASKPATHIGDGFRLLHKNATDETARSFKWTFKDVPKGKYHLAVNLPRFDTVQGIITKPEITQALVKDGARPQIATRFRYKISVNGSPPSPVIFDRKLQGWGPEPDNGANGEVVSEEIGDANPRLGGAIADVAKGASVAGGRERATLIDTKDPHASLKLWYALPFLDASMQGDTEVVTIEITLSTEDADGFAVADSIRLERIKD